MQIINAISGVFCDDINLSEGQDFILVKSPSKKQTMKSGEYNYFKSKSTKEFGSYKPQ